MDPTLVKSFLHKESERMSKREDAVTSDVALTSFSFAFRSVSAT